jgi:hypothetical protein
MHLASPRIKVIGVLLLLLTPIAIFNLASQTSVASDSMNMESPTPTPNSSVKVATSVSTPLDLNVPKQITPEFLRNEPHANDYLNGGLGTDDVDCDGVKNQEDNCIFVFNPSQRRSRSGSVGDACNPKLKKHKERDVRCDADRDGIFDEKDNCILVSNPDQRDRNKNGIGDACEKPN